MSRAYRYITGSAGKTTTKEITAHVLSQCGYRVLKSERNYNNNNLGLPLSVLQMVGVVSPAITTWLCSRWNVLAHARNPSPSVNHPARMWAWN
jgi:UDP-N-acetylmuramoyl-tripeptide--D-alanyl-D-alanine ligase